MEPAEDHYVPRIIFRDRENPLNHLSDEKLLQEYRFDRRARFDMTNKLDGDLDHVTHRNHSLPAVLQLLIALRFFATGSFQTVVGDIFHVHKSSVSRVVLRVAGALSCHLNATVNFCNLLPYPSRRMHFSSSVQLGFLFWFSLSIPIS